MNVKKRANKVVNLRERLCDRHAYPHPFESEVVVHTTHISWVFLAGDFAYKVKRPLKTEFLDYSTLSKRKRMCEAEVRLGGRFAPDLYLGVVPITRGVHGVMVEGGGEVIDYAVKMRRFPEQALLSHRIEAGLVSDGEVRQLANRVAAFHLDARRSSCGSAGVEAPWRNGGMADPIDWVAADTKDNFRDLEGRALGDSAKTLRRLKGWADRFLAEHRDLFVRRARYGFVCECHGDLHLANVIAWRGQLIPFDGIEFDSRYRWIDVLSDACFVVMDFAARGRPDLGNSFLNHYLEVTGDYYSLPLIRWYLVYRALVRAKVAAIRSDSGSESQRRVALEECRRHVELAATFSQPSPLRLWITHGFSGSGKTVGSEATVREQGAIRIRSDVERKRLHGLSPQVRANARQRRTLYSRHGTRETYRQLRNLCREVLRSGHSVIADATFLRASDRAKFQQLAAQWGAQFEILDAQVPIDTLRERLRRRRRQVEGVSDADMTVLHKQLGRDEPLSVAEHRWAVPIGSAERASLEVSPAKGQAESRGTHSAV